jgi:uncharacterized protein (DUF488 family)
MFMKPAIYTIGYEGVTAEAFIAALKEAGVEALLDIRAVPLSRKPGFSKNKLAERAGAAGIRYVPMKGLGTPTEGRAAARKGNAGELRRIYEEHLLTQEAVDDMNRALELVQNTKCCLLCFEHAPGCCHRLIVAERLAEATGQLVEHLDPVAASLL